MKGKTKQQLYQKLIALFLLLVFSAFSVSVPVLTFTAAAAEDTESAETDGEDVSEGNTDDEEEAQLDTNLSDTGSDSDITITDPETENASAADKGGDKSGVSLTPGENNAYIVLGNPVKSRMMTFEDGVAQGITNVEDPHYSEEFIKDDITGRRVYKKNYLDITVDPDFYQKGDNTFLVLITYYDFGPDRGTFQVQYGNEKGGKSSCTVVKYGITPKWCTERTIWSNVGFGGNIDGKYDIRIFTNLYNAYAKIELVNLSALFRESGSDENLEMGMVNSIEMGTVNSIQAGVLGELGLYEGPDGQPADAGLEQKITRGEMVKLVLRAIGKEDKALSEKRTSSFSDIPPDLQPYLGYAESIGMINGTGEEKFEPDTYATPRQLLMCYFRLLDIEDEDLWNQAVDVAERIRLVLKNDLIYFPDRFLTRDNFAAIAYNALRVDNEMTGNSFLKEMLLDGRVTGEQLEKTGRGEMAAYRYIIPQYMPPVKMTDSESGRSYNLLTFNGNKAIRSYVNQQEFNSDATKFIIGNDKMQAMFEYDMQTYEMTFLDYCTVGGSLTAVVNPQDQIFYRNNEDELWQMDWKTKKKHRIGKMPAGVVGGDGISVMNDGSYIGVKWLQKDDPKDFFPTTGENRYRVLARLDTKTGEFYTERSHEFDDNPETAHLGHPILNPVDKDLMFFCHEGTAELVPDRLWVANLATGEEWNVFRQAANSDGTTGESSGHELWTLDGKNIIFVKYKMKKSIGKTGICRVSVDGEEREYFNDDYSFWHCTSTGDGEWVAGDTNRSPREIALVSTKTYQSHLLAKFRVGPSGQHPYQPHPTLSWNGKMIAWQQTNEQDQLGTAWMDVSDITGADIPGGTVEYNDKLSYVTYPNCEFEVERKEVEGEECITAQKDCGIYMDIHDEWIKTYCGAVTLDITYLDEGKMPILVKYTDAILTPQDYANQENQVIQIRRNNTGTWKTVSVPLKRASLYNSGKHLTDFVISGLYSDVVVKDVKVRADA